MVIKIADYIKHCSNNEEGKIIFNIIKPLLDDKKKLEVSFEGISSTSSSFINTAFLELLEYYDFDYIKQHLNFIKCNRTINKLIKYQFEFETKHRSQAEEEIKGILKKLSSEQSMKEATS